MRISDWSSDVCSSDLLSAAHVLIATGGHARRPDITGNEHGIDSNGFFDLCAAPRKVAVIGAGYIAVELAGVLRALGSEVHLLVRGERLLRTFDRAIGDALHEAMPARGIEVVFGHELDQVSRESDGKLGRASGRERGGQ